jgi:hypothetical protein
MRSSKFVVSYVLYVDSSLGVINLAVSSDDCPGDSGATGVPNGWDFYYQVDMVQCK